MDTSGELAVTAPIGVPARRRFVAYHKWDRNFFLVFLALCWLGVLMGFAPAATKRFAGHADYPAPLILEIHAFAFSAWMALLTAQIGLIRMRRPQLHMKLGLIAMGLIPLMAVSAFMSEVYSQRFRSAQADEREFFVIAIFYVSHSLPWQARRLRLARTHRRTSVSFYSRRPSSWARPTGAGGAPPSTICSATATAAC